MERARTALIWIVAGGWLWNLVAPAFLSSYEPKLEASGPLLAIIGALFVTKKKKDES